jgi:galactokinase
VAELTVFERALDALGDAGLDPAALPDRAALISRVADAFEHEVGRRPVWAWWVPGRIEVFGKHTDYAGGRSLVTAVPRGFAVVASPRSDAVVVARDAKWQTGVAVPLREDRRALGGWANYIAVVVRRLARDFPGAQLGADVMFESDLPRAAGVSSSSALVVGVSTALIRCATLEERPAWQTSITSVLDLANYLGAVENGRAFGGFEGTAGVGTHGGSEDHTAILAARAGWVRAFAYVPVRPAGEAPLPRDWMFAVLSSGVHAAKAGAARVQYNTASLATRAIEEVWFRHAGTRPISLGALLSGGSVTIDDLRGAIRHETHADFTADDLERRLAHFVDEDARVPDALEAFAHADAARLGQLAQASQTGADVLLRNQTPETSALASAAADAGAFAASSFGAGFGGSVWAMVPAVEAAGCLERWRMRYLERYPARQHAEGFLAPPAPPVTEVPLDPPAL